MTNTINVPRELLENIVLCYNEGDFELGTLAAECHALLSAPSSANHVEDVRAMVADPSPAGVDGLKPAAMIRRKSPLGTEYACEAISYNLPNGTELCRLSDAHAIIDGLRGENERIRLNIAEYNEAIASYQSERDQQTQRIGELEGLLREVRLPDDIGRMDIWARIDSALSAGKE